MTKDLANRIRFIITNNHLDVDDLVVMLEITPEDIMERFEDRMNEHADKFVPDGYIVEDEDLETSYEPSEEQQEELEERSDH